MDFDFGWIVAFSFFFALGWLAAKIDVKQLVRESRRLPESYFKGLNFLVNHEEEQAISSFVDAARSHPETIELQLTLGQLFRKRGELNRAIYLHQSLLDRFDHDPILTQKIQFELGQDYLKSGLLDRAETLFTQLARMTESPVLKQTLEALMSVYVIEHEWIQAIQILKRLMIFEPENLYFKQMCAQFYCEAALELFQAQEPYDQAHFFLQEALKNNPQCVRAHLIYGQILEKKQEPITALGAWFMIEKQSPVHLLLVLPDMLQTYQKIKEMTSFITHLERLQEQYPTMGFELFLFDVLFLQKEHEQAYLLIQNALRKSASLGGLVRLLTLQIMEMADQKRQQDLKLIHHLLIKHQVQTQRYVCAHCHFEAHQFHWCCPACGHWEGFTPQLPAQSMSVPLEV